MNTMLKALCAVCTLLLALLAMPATAASSSQKYFFAAFPTLLPVGTYTTTFQVSNATPPPGVATINSMEVDAPSGVTIDTATSSPGSWSLQSTKADGTKVYIVNNLPGIKSGQSKVFSIKVTVNATTCSAKTWGIVANTGNAYPQGDTFVDNHPAAENLVSAVGCDGVLDCGDTATDSSSVPSWQLTRGDNYDGSACVVIPYKFTLDKASKTASFIADKSSGQAIAVQYTVYFDPVNLDASGLTTGWTAKRPNLAWALTGTGAPDYVPALACLTDTLVGEAPLPTIPNVAPFNTYPSTHPYYPGNLARMCVAELNWTSFNGQAQYAVKVTDESDGFVNIP